ncbi:hypothetical protein [Longispora albida]|uniref:hypothetical protein n=1 Tax=Longispora albida TaxID=203523 RepID=UPI0003A78856|nr:hypothetical protein [Longispora albida]
MEATLAEELELLREDVRDDIRTAAKATHAALLREVQSLRNEVDSLRERRPVGAAPVTATASVPAGGPGVVHHTETVQVTTRQTTLTADHAHPGEPGRGRAAAYPQEAPAPVPPPAPAPVVARATARPREYDSRPAIETSRIEPSAVLGTPPVIARGQQHEQRQYEPEPVSYGRRAAPEPVEDAPRRARREPDPEPEPQPQQPRSWQQPQQMPARDVPRGERWRDEPQVSREPDPRDLGPRGDGRRAARRAESEEAPSFSDMRTGPRSKDPWADLRSPDPELDEPGTARSAGEAWAEMRSDQHGDELRMGERRAEIRSGEYGQEFRASDRWASVRQEPSAPRSGRRQQREAIESSWRDGENNAPRRGESSSWRGAEDEDERTLSGWTPPREYTYEEDTGYRPREERSRDERWR